MSDIIDSITVNVEKINMDLIKGLRQKGGGITDNEARFLVDMYYSIQKDRIIQNNRVKGLERDAKKSNSEPEPHEALTFTLR